MKRSMLNTAISLAITTNLLISPALSVNAYADTPDSSVIKHHISHNKNLDDSNNFNSRVTSADSYMFPGLGAGAATGTVIAGPVGLIVGSVIGAFIGSAVDKEPGDKTVTNAGATNTTQSKPAISTIGQSSNKAVPIETKPSIQLAQLAPLNSIPETTLDIQQEKIMNILVSDLSLDVYFRSGSTDIESFYPVRLAAIANLMNAMDKLEIHLDGYTDRRGNKTQNVLLANQRIDKVREHLVNAGVEHSRIISKAFGEAKMKSTAGDLDAYTFDRRVVIRFEQAKTNTDSTMAVAPSMTGSGNTSHVTSDSVSRF